MPRDQEYWFHLSAYTRTPLVALDFRRRGVVHRLWLKLESCNPTGSIKYRTAAGLLSAMAAVRPIESGMRVVESTSGNLGIALTRLLASVDCQFVAVVDPKLTPYMRRALLAEGARLVMVTERDMHGSFLLQRLRKVNELLIEDPSLRWTNQYHNIANPAIHRQTSAVEILHQTNGKVDLVLGSVSTGGTLAGLSCGLRDSRRDTRICAVDAHGSLVTSDTAKAHLLTGIGACRKSAFLHHNAYDFAVQVHDVEAFAFCRMLAADTGLSVGGSSGAVLCAFSRLIAENLHNYAYPVAVIPDSGDGYLETIYSDKWLAGHGVLSAVRTAQALLRADGISFELSAT